MEPGGWMVRLVQGEMRDEEVRCRLSKVEPV